MIRLQLYYDYYNLKLIIIIMKLSFMNLEALLTQGGMGYQLSNDMRVDGYTNTIRNSRNRIIIPEYYYKYV